MYQNVHWCLYLGLLVWNNKKTGQHDSSNDDYAFYFCQTLGHCIQSQLCIASDTAVLKHSIHIHFPSIQRIQHPKSPLKLILYLSKSVCAQEAINLNFDKTEICACVFRGRMIRYECVYKEGGVCMCGCVHVDIKHWNKFLTYWGMCIWQGQKHIFWPTLHARVCVCSYGMCVCICAFVCLCVCTHENLSTQLSWPLSSHISRDPLLNSKESGAFW